MLKTKSHRFGLIVLATLGFALSGCQSTGNQTVQNIPTPPSVNHKDACGVSNNLPLIGTDADRLDLSSFPKGTRLLYPNSPMSLDYRPDRLNIYANDKGKIVRLDCK